MTSSKTGIYSEREIKKEKGVVDLLTSCRDINNE